MKTTIKDYVATKVIIENGDTRIVPTTRSERKILTSVIKSAVDLAHIGCDVEALILMAISTADNLLNDPSINLYMTVADSIKDLI